jgi:PAS domain S-box-containing protein
MKQWSRRRHSACSPNRVVHASDPQETAERILILAPAPRDAEDVSAAAAEGGFTAKVVPDVAQLCGSIRSGAGMVALVESAFSPADVAALRETLLEQPPWSDLLVLILSADVERDEARQRMVGLAEMLAPAGIVSFAERPFVDRMLIARFATALRVRRRQYAARALLDQLELEHRRGLAVLAALPVGTFVTDAAGRVIAANAEFERIWSAQPVGLTPEAFSAYKAWRVGSASDKRHFQWRVMRVLASDQPAPEEELEIEAFDGVRRTILASGYPIHDARGALTGVVGVQVDVTDRARAQRASRVLSEATAAIFESLDPAVTPRTLCRVLVTHLADSCAIYEMDEHCELRQLIAETSGAPAADEAARLLAYVPAASANSLAARVLKSGTPLLVSEVPADWHALGLEEHRVAFVKIGVYSLMALPLVARGRPLGVLGIVSTRPDRRYDARDVALAQEISRRAAIALDNARLHRQAQDAVQTRDQSLAEFEALLNASPVGFAALDRSLRFQRINLVLSELFGRPAVETVGQTLEDVVPAPFQAQLAPLLRRVLQTGTSLLDNMIVGELPAGSGRTRHLLSSFLPLLDVTGSTRALGMMVTDVTRLKEAEAALREEAAFRERFIGVVAHDLRSPLHAIVLSAAALKRQSDAPAPWVQTLGRIAHAADRMERMVGNLLDLVRSREGGGIPVNRKRADLAAVVREVVEELEASHPGRQIVVSTAGDTSAEIDAERMAEVVSNLAGNALAYSPDGTAVRVEVSGSDGELTLAVHNDGAPIEPETLKTIFAPYRRGAEPGTGPPAMRGLGLGLFIVGEIARAHDGTVAVSSTAEEGTTFTVRLSRTCAKAEAEQHAYGGQ